MQSLVFTAPALIFVCFSISSSFCILVFLPDFITILWFCPTYELFFLCLVGRLDGAFRHGELVVFRIFLSIGTRRSL
jgi:hypothetical protein